MQLREAAPSVVCIICHCGVAVLLIGLGYLRIYIAFPTTLRRSGEAEAGRNRGSRKIVFRLSLRPV